MLDQTNIKSTIVSPIAVSVFTAVYKHISPAVVMIILRNMTLVRYSVSS